LVGDAPPSGDQEESHQERRQKWGEALELVRLALAILDETKGPHHIAAQLDSAINGLLEETQKDQPPSPPR